VDFPGVGVTGARGREMFAADGPLGCFGGGEARVNYRVIRPVPALVWRQGNCAVEGMEELKRAHCWKRFGRDAELEREERRACWDHGGGGSWPSLTTGARKAGYTFDRVQTHALLSPHLRLHNLRRSGGLCTGATGAHVLADLVLRSFFMHNWSRGVAPAGGSSWLGAVRGNGTSRGGKRVAGFCWCVRGVVWAAGKAEPDIGVAAPAWVEGVIGDPQNCGTFNWAR